MSVNIPANERSRDRNTFGIYCVNFFGSGLNSIKDEFKRQVGTGLRRNVFVLDLAEVQSELNNQPRNTKMRKELKDNANKHLMNLVLQHIQEFCKTYELKSKKINEELKFDLYQYWLKDISSDKAKSNKSVKDMKETNKSTLVTKQHNILGHSPALSKKKYIKDEPILGKLYIIILGQMGSLFYMDLLSLNQPLEGIVNFIPTEGNYDILLGNNKLRNFITSTLEAITNSQYKLRQEVALKPVGLFTHKLPVISDCLASKHSREVFDQLTWSIYDIDVLRQQYENYYLKPFQVTDVELPASDNLTELYHMVEALTIKGHFQESSIPASDSDLASIACYLNTLLSNCCFQEDLLEEGQRISLNTTTTLQNQFPNSLSTITKISKYGRLVVAENNKLLLNMLQYTDVDKLHSIYLCCLDYNVIRKYVIPQKQKSTIISESPSSQRAYLSTLPQYVKYYPNVDCSCQRISELENAYDECEIQDISIGYKLYIFKRKYYILQENQGCIVIPTRLCFRDFTLFQMEEFLRDLRRPKLNTSSTHSIEKTAEIIDLDANIFIRSKSVKSLLQKEKSEEIKAKKAETSQARIIEENQGLDPDHHLLKGYNLGDTLQEVKYKTSKYHFQHGYVKLYEEKWCSQVMNKLLSLSINSVTLFFNQPRRQMEGISNNIRLTTENNISIRILNDPKERSKIIMNNPKGLSVFHHEDCCEQVWYCEETIRNEERRIFTHFGAIIVFFKSQDVITILRYNGEIYRLYQHELVEEEEEVEDGASIFDEIEKKSSGQEELSSQMNSTQSDQVIKRRVRKKKSLKQFTADTKHPSEESMKDSAEMELTSHNLISSINFEVKFLNFLCSKYGLTYLHVVITTSQGKCINLTQQGEIFEGHQCFIDEWHDYFANEAYCERSDGVKMLWAQDYFNCYHADGTVFTTAIGDELAEPDGNESEFEITQSSSHMGFLEEMEDNEYQKLDRYKSQEISAYEKLTAEEHKPYDTQFVRYKTKSWLMQHENYDKVYILNDRLPTSNVHVEIFGSDNIRIYLKVQDDDRHNIPSFGYLRTGSEEYMEDRIEIKFIVNVLIGDSLRVEADTETCKIWAAASSSQNEKESGSESLNLSLKYTDYINDTFKYFVDKVASFGKNAKQELEELYFIEKINSDCSIRGFEFFTSLPITSDYNYYVSNNVTEIKAVNSVNETVICNCEAHKRNLSKFPRFKQKEKTYNNPVNEFPRFLSANVFIEIPKQLLSLTNVTKFLEPFENINFKSLRGKFKKVLSIHLEPKRQLHLKMFISKKNWKERQKEHERRLLIERQRLGLYNAMYKHKTYPNYWKFTESYGSEVKHINLLNFMQNVCDKKKSRSKLQR